MEKKEYIERGAILRKSETMFDGQKYCTAVNTGFIYTAPAADVVELVHGKWVHHYYDSGEPIDDKWYCSECHMCNDHRRTWYCPNCSAKMDGGKHEQT